MSITSSNTPLTDALRKIWKLEEENKLLKEEKMEFKLDQDMKDQLDYIMGLYNLPNREAAMKYCLQQEKNKIDKEKNLQKTKCPTCEKNLVG